MAHRTQALVPSAAWTSRCGVNASIFRYVILDEQRFPCPARKLLNQRQHGSRADGRRPVDNDISQAGGLRAMSP
jgi:hypothetical protein